ncbi:hypothetical protein GCM10009802_44830 [Streptomyces synnematoformans]|uniref:Uncharacterized protein n=1 Tax=Streptomyces synnematoformans TaxID=415721 RepID=A0ABN2Z366_9ACTN
MPGVHGRDQHRGAGGARLRAQAGQAGAEAEERGRQAHVDLAPPGGGRGLVRGGDADIDGDRTDATAAEF